MTFKFFNIEITCRVVKRSRRTGYSARNWTETETNTVLRLRNEGKTAQEIGKMLNRTTAAINTRISKVRRHNV